MSILEHVDSNSEDEKMKDNDEVDFNYAIVQKNPEIKLYYAECLGPSEDAPLMVFLHGFAEYWYAWSEYLPHFAKLGFHVVAPDLRGFHESDKPTSVNDYDIKILVNDIKNLILSFGKEKAIVIGHDWGGAIVWELADLYPNVCEAVVVLNCPHRGSFAKNMKKDLTLMVKQNFRSWYLYFFQCPLLPELALECCDYKWVEFNFHGLIKNKVALSDERIQNYKDAMVMPGALTAAINYYRANVSGEYGRDIIRAMFGIKKFNKIKVPCLLIWGEDDLFLEKELTYNMEEFFEKPISIKYIPNCSHWVHLEKSDQVMSLIHNFIVYK
jgi:pimeloyl-ACP methyl ester carboxylesterase